MADVQLEHGHVRIANRLLEAILDANFTGTQLKIVLGLLRLTYGWRQKNVTVRVADLAAALRLSPKGGFRRDLRELIEEGVVREVRAGGAGSPATLAVQKDFCRWGKFCVSEQRLAAVWGVRYPCVEEPTPGHESDPPGLETLEGNHPLGSPLVTLEGQNIEPSRVTIPLRKLRSGAQIAARKDSERQDRHATTTGAAIVGSVVDPPAEAAVLITAAANRGITACYGEQPVPLRHDAPTSRRAADAILAAGVPLQFAIDAMYTAAKHCPLERPPRSLGYWVGAVVDAWAARQARDAAEQLPEPSEIEAAPRKLTPAPRKTFAEQEAEFRERKEREEREHNLARVRWGNVDQHRRMREDGEEWWERMQAEAKQLGRHPVLYAYDHIDRAAEIRPRAEQSA